MSTRNISTENGSCEEQRLKDIAEIRKVIIDLEAPKVASDSNFVDEAKDNGEAIPGEEAGKILDRYLESIGYSDDWKPKALKVFRTKEELQGDKKSEQLYAEWEKAREANCKKRFSHGGKSQQRDGVIVEAAPGKFEFLEADELS